MHHASDVFEVLFRMLCIRWTQLCALTQIPHDEGVCLLIPTRNRKRRTAFHPELCETIYAAFCHWPESRISQALISLQHRTPIMPEADETKQPMIITR